MTDNLAKLLHDIPEQVKLVAVSKTHTVEEIVAVYNAGIRDFGENKVQELISKQPFLPKDIHWHLIGHLQTNKVKSIAPFIHLIQSVDSLRLLTEINNQAKKNNRVIDCLLQIYIAREESKFGMDFIEAEELLSSPAFKLFSNIRITGLMGMATFTDDEDQVRNEFRDLKKFYEHIRQSFFNSQDYFSILSIGMSGDYKIAIEEGSTMVRIGTAIFGERNYKKM